jgi:hypothetical protein
MIFADIPYQKPNITQLAIYSQKPGEPFDPSRLGKHVQRWFKLFNDGLASKAGIGSGTASSAQISVCFNDVVKR